MSSCLLVLLKIVHIGHMVPFYVYFNKLKLGSLNVLYFWVKNIGIWALFYLSDFVQNSHPPSPPPSSSLNKLFALT